MTSSKSPSTIELLTFNATWVVVLGDITDLSRAWDGLYRGWSEETRTNDDPRLIGGALCPAGLGGGSTVVVRTIGAICMAVRDNGRITTSFPPKFKAEFREFSSVSGLSKSELTITGNSTKRIS